MYFVLIGFRIIKVADFGLAEDTCVSTSLTTIDKPLL